MTENKGLSFENVIMSAFAYPGVCLRYLFYGTKRPVRELLNDGLDINAFAFFWLIGMVFAWSSILNKI